MRERRKELRSEEISIAREVEAIVRAAAAGTSKVVSLPPLVFFSTRTRDAWVLDAHDDLALPADAGRRASAGDDHRDPATLRDRLAGDVCDRWRLLHLHRSRRQSAHDPGVSHAACNCGARSREGLIVERITVMVALATGEGSDTGRGLCRAEHPFPFALTARSADSLGRARLCRPASLASLPAPVIETAGASSNVAPPAAADDRA